MSRISLKTENIFVWRQAFASFPTWLPHVCRPSLSPVSLHSPTQHQSPSKKRIQATEKRKRLTPTKKYKVKIVTRPDKETTQPSQRNAQAPMNSENQKPLTSENNPPPLEKAPVHASTPWPEAGKMSGNLFELRKVWPIPPANITMPATDPKLQVKIEPQDPGQQNQVQQHQNQSNADGDQTVLSARMWKKIGMVSIRSNFSNLTKMLKQIHSRNVQSRPKIQGKPRHKTLSTPKTTRYHKILSPPRHGSLMCQTTMQNKYD